MATAPARGVLLQRASTACSSSTPLRLSHHSFQTLHLRTIASASTTNPQAAANRAAAAATNRAAAAAASVSNTMGSSPSRRRRPSPPKTPIHERAPPSEEKTQTDFAAMDVLRDFATPATSIESTLPEGFVLNNGQSVRDGSGLMMVGGDALKWRPWTSGSGSGGSSDTTTSGSSSDSSDSDSSSLVNAKGQWDVDGAAWGVLRLAWPRPDLLIVGTGASTRPLSPRTRRDIGELGVRVEVQDTRNAAAQFNLLATERGVQQVAAAMVPLGRRGG